MSSLSFRTINQIQSFHESKGMYFFSEDSKRFFSSRIHSDVYGGCVFVTSEKFDWKSPRLFSVRMITESGSIKTIGGFQGFDTRSKAHTFAKNYAQNI